MKLGKYKAEQISDINLLLQGLVTKCMSYPEHQWESIEYTEKRIKDTIRQQTLLDLLAHFSEYNVPLQMTAKDVQDEIIKFMEQGGYETKPTQDLPNRQERAKLKYYENASQEKKLERVKQLEIDYYDRPEIQLPTLIDKCKQLVDLVNKMADRIEGV
jgi:hypothetical protein